MSCRYINDNFILKTYTIKVMKKNIMGSINDIHAENTLLQLAFENLLPVTQALVAA